MEEILALVIDGWWREVSKGTGEAPRTIQLLCLDFRKIPCLSQGTRIDSAASFPASH